jgi:hypothetical protein
MFTILATGVYVKVDITKVSYGCKMLQVLRSLMLRKISYSVCPRESFTAKSDICD